MTVQTDFLERCKALNLHDGKLSDWLDEIESLRQQLAAALAVCKQKDEELEKIRGHIGLYNLFSCVGSDSYDPECADLNVGKCGEIATKALAIQPDDSAHGRIEELKAALEIAKKGLRHYENRNAAHGTRNPAAIALDDIAATLKGLK